MKIVITDDDGDVVFEQDNPGWVHLPIMMDGKHDFYCEDDDCPDPRCVERREEATAFIRQWTESGEELGLYFHFNSDQDEDINEFEKLPNIRVPKKVKLQSFSGKEIVFTSGDRLGYYQPRLNVYSSNQVMFETDKWDASLVPWRDSHDKRVAEESAKKMVH
jgi:hypothetical protein